MTNIIKSLFKFLVHDNIYYIVPPKIFLTACYPFPTRVAHTCSLPSPTNTRCGSNFVTAPIPTTRYLSSFNFYNSSGTVFATDLDRRQWRTCRKIAGTLLTVQKITETARVRRIVSTLLPMVQVALQPQVLVTLSLSLSLSIYIYIYIYIYISTPLLFHWISVTVS